MQSRSSRIPDIPHQFGRFLRWAATLAITLICLGYAVFRWESPQHALTMIDHQVFRLAISQVRAGHDYYAGMDASLRTVYGPAESARAFRMPYPFYVWALVSNERVIWLMLIVLAGLTAALLSRLCKYPIAALAAPVYLLNIGIWTLDGHCVFQFLTSELWAVPPMALAIWSWQTERIGLAAFSVFLALLTRETAAVLLAGGILATCLTDRPRWPWIVVGLMAVVCYVLHCVRVAPYLVEAGVGRETPLLGTAAFPASILEIVGFGLPGGTVSGPLFWLAAMFALIRGRTGWWFMLPLMLFPVVGMFVSRPYWGILLVPFTLTFGLDVMLGVAIPAVFRIRGNALSAGCTV